MAKTRPTPAVILAVISFGVFVAADDLTVISTLLRQIIFDLELPLPEGLNEAAWIVNAYLIAYVAVMPVAGKASDLLGRRVVYITAYVLFIAGSFWVPLASGLGSLVFGRVLTALGGGAMVPVGMAIIGDIYAAEKRPAALGKLGAVDTAGWVWGPFYGALLIRFLSWRWQFYLNIPLGLLGLLLTLWALRQLPRHRVSAPIDWMGLLFLTGALFTLNLALLRSSDIQLVGSMEELSRPDRSSNPVLYLIALLLALLFVINERGLLPDIMRLSRSSDSNNASSFTLIDLKLLQKRNFVAAILVNFLVGAVLIIAMINVPLLVNVLEIDINEAAWTSGLLLSTMTISMALFAYGGGRLVERYGYRLVTAAGLLLCVAAFAVMGLTWLPQTEYGEMVWQLVILGAGFGLIIAPIGSAVINTAPEDQLGIASSFVIVLRLSGMSVGLSSLTAWGLYRFNILREAISLPPIDNPGYQSALTRSLTSVTVAVLAETFLISAIIALVALLISFLLQPE